MDRMYFKLWISDIHMMLPSPIQERANKFRGRTVERVIVFGTVTKVKEIGTKILYEIDDGTGNINCIFHHGLLMDNKLDKLVNELNLCRINSGGFCETDSSCGKNDEQTSSAITNSLKWLTKEVYKHGRKTKTVFDLGDTICVKGRINDFFGLREIQIYQLHLIDNLKDETGHVLDFVNLYKNEYCNFLNSSVN